MQWRMCHHALVAQAPIPMLCTFTKTELRQESKNTLASSNPSLADSLRIVCR